MRNVRTGFDASLTANALFGVDHSNVAVLGANISRAYRAIPHAQWLGTLPAYVLLNIERILGENCPVYLNPRQR